MIKQNQSTIIVKVTSEQRDEIDKAVEKSMRTIASIARQAIMEKVNEILKETK